MHNKQVSIALQGGGIQSAFAWGVLDFLLQDGRLEIMGISSTGLGGIAGAALIQGLIQGGNKVASSILREYWISIYNLLRQMAPLATNPLEQVIKYYNFSDNWSSFSTGISPYDKNPLNINPFLEFLESFFYYNIINEEKEKKIFISTTHVESGKIKIFSNEEISSDVLMASFCLPYVFHSVEINSEHYWDGGMVANPAINPLINGVPSKDIIVIQLSKTRCPSIPTEFEDIKNRIMEINYNSHLLREMRAIYFISKLIDEKKITNGSLKRINMHVIRNESYDLTNNLFQNFTSDWQAIIDLYTEGYNTAKRWLSINYEKICISHSALSSDVFGAYL
ncbi:MAG: patatin-like phospholipase family protein [Holosporales bacterium]|nr:patatin-like phospholipase family protein [Holosporales bacterium]